MTRFSFKEYEASISEKMRVKFASKTIKKTPKIGDSKLKKPKVSSKTACFLVSCHAKRPSMADQIIQCEKEYKPKTMDPACLAATTRDWTLLLQ